MLPEHRQDSTGDNSGGYRMEFRFRRFQHCRERLGEGRLPLEGRRGELDGNWFNQRELSRQLREYLLGCGFRGVYS